MESRRDVWICRPVQEIKGINALHRLGSGDGLQCIGDLYGIHMSTLSKIINEFFVKLFGNVFN